jgi:hypothetical protein
MASGVYLTFFGSFVFGKPGFPLSDVPPVAPGTVIPTLTGNCDSGGFITTTHAAADTPITARKTSSAQNKGRLGSVLMPRLVASLGQSVQTA